MFLLKKTNNLLPIWTNRDFLIRTCSEPGMTACVIWGHFKKLCIQLISVNSLPTHLLGADRTAKALCHFLEFHSAVPALEPHTLCPQPKAQEPRAAVDRGASSMTRLAAALLASSAGFLGLCSPTPQASDALRHKVLYRTGGPTGDQDWGLCHLPWQHPACALSHAGQGRAILSGIGDHSCSQAGISCGPKHPHCAIPAGSTRK